MVLSSDRWRCHRSVCVIVSETAERGIRQSEIFWRNKQCSVDATYKKFWETEVVRDNIIGAE